MQAAGLLGQASFCVLILCMSAVCVRLTTAWRMTRPVCGRATRRQICMSCCSSRCRACRACCWGRGSSRWDRPQQSARWSPTQRPPQRCAGSAAPAGPRNPWYPLPWQARVLAANSGGCPALLHDASCLKAAYQPTWHPEAAVPWLRVECCFEAGLAPLAPTMRVRSASGDVPDDCSNRQVLLSAVAALVSQQHG